jgi:hypothetical protein
MLLGALYCPCDTRATDTGSLILWSTFPLTVLPCWIGSVIGILYVPPFSNASLKLFFAVFCICLAAFVLYAADQGGNASIFAAVTSEQLAYIPFI